MGKPAERAFIPISGKSGDCCEGYFTEDRSPGKEADRDAFPFEIVQQRKECSPGHKDKKDKTDKMDKTGERIPVRLCRCKPDCGGGLRTAAVSLCDFAVS